MNNPVESSRRDWVWRPVEEPIELEEGDVVRVGEEGSIEEKFGEYVVRIEANQQARILRFRGLADDDGNPNIHYDRGARALIDIGLVHKRIPFRKPKQGDIWGNEHYSWVWSGMHWLKTAVHGSTQADEPPDNAYIIWRPIPVEEN